MSFPLFRRAARSFLSMAVAAEVCTGSYSDRCDCPIGTIPCNSVHAAERTRREPWNIPWRRQNDRVVVDRCYRKQLSPPQIAQGFLADPMWRAVPRRQGDTLEISLSTSPDTRDFHPCS